MDSGFSMMNTKGKFCYGIKLAVKLVEYYGYDRKRWYDFLAEMSDYTLIDICSGTQGRYSKHWSASDYSPAEILEPVYMPDKNGRDFYPCDICGKCSWLFSENGAESGFCLNFKNCCYVAEHYRYARSDKNQYSTGKYKENYDLFMSTDINLLRIIYDTVSLTDETAGELFDGDREPLMRDMLSVFGLISIELPDLSGIPDEGFGKNSSRSFDCINLLRTLEEL